MSETLEDRVSRFDATSTSSQVMAGIDLTGKTAIVTGGGSGLGVETARALALAGASVTIAVRDLEAGRRVAEAIDSEVGAARVSVAELELGDLASVRRFAQAWGDRPLHLLINNAGVMACPLGRTADGFESQFGINHLGHFLLTELLVPALERGAPSRVVVLSSSAHHFSDIDFEDPHYRSRPYKPMEAYGQSKTANALFALEFDRRYGDRGVHAFSVMPGVIVTPLLRHMNAEVQAEIRTKLVESRADQSSERSKPRSPEQGAATSLWAATAPELEAHGGAYLEDCRIAPAYEFGGPLRGIAAYGRDADRASRLWRLSEAEVELTPAKQ